MTENRGHNLIILLLQTVVVVICIVGFYGITEKAGISADLEDHGGKVYCRATEIPPQSGAVRPGDNILTVDRHVVQRVEEVEFILDGRHIGDSIEVSVARADGQARLTLLLAPYYGVPYLVIVVLLVFLFLGVGMVVYWTRPRDIAAQVFHFGSLTTALMLTTTWGSYAIRPAWLGPVVRAVFSLAYTLTPAIFFHFTVVFPSPKWAQLKRWLGAVYAVGCVLGVGTGVMFAVSVAEASLPRFEEYLGWFTTSRVFLIILVISGIVSIVHSYRTAGIEPERRKLRWVLWGLVVGFTPFTLLWILPQVLLSYSLVSEEVMLLASGVIPVSFGISIVKYHIMDIDLLFNRSAVYGIVMTLLGAVYLVILGAAAMVVSSMTTQLTITVSSLGAIVVALLFEPVRRRVQVFVDKRFFRVRYDFRIAERQFVNQLKHCVDLQQMGTLIIEQTDALIPMERSGFFVIRQPGDRLVSVANRGLMLLERHSIRFETENLRTPLDLPVALDDRIETGIPHESADPEMCARWKVVLIFPMLSESRSILGFLVLGEKKSGGRYTSEDIDLLSNVVAHAGLELERITLQRQLMEKQAEAQHLEALNQLKSEFVSYVSHELRTPLTSIKMFAELMSARRPKHAAKAREYARIIDGEADRLNRLVNTILDSAKIEQGVKTYNFRDVDLGKIASRVMDAMEYQLRKQGFNVRFKPHRSPLPVYADPDAVGEALMNLVANSLKYSSTHRDLWVKMGKRGDRVFCTVRDRGCGISREALPHLFEKFYRDPAFSGRIEGVGLGLALVKHIVDAHGGSIDVQSTQGKGSMFHIELPSPRHRDGQKNKNTHRRR